MFRRVSCVVPGSLHAGLTEPEPKLPESDEGAAAGAEEDAAQHVQLGALPDGLGAQVPEQAASASVGQAVAVAAAAVAPEEDLPQSGRFGVFRVTKKGRGYQARCCFHRKSMVSECKKFISLVGSSHHDACATWRLLAWWCVRAPTFDRQRDHVGFTPTIDTCPPISEILAMKNTEGPTARVKSDVELDEQLAAEHVTPAQGAVSRGGARDGGAQGGAAGVVEQAVAAEAVQQQRTTPLRLVAQRVSQAPQIQVRPAAVPPAVRHQQGIQGEVLCFRNTGR